MFRVLFNWLLNFAESIGAIWTWLVTETEILGFDIAPIYLVVGGMLITGVIRAITGIL